MHSKYIWFIFKYSSVIEYSTYNQLFVFIESNYRMKYGIALWNKYIFVKITSVLGVFRIICHPDPN